jgi:hypothetical protein
MELLDHVLRLPHPFVLDRCNTGRQRHTHQQACSTRVDHLDVLHLQCEAYDPANLRLMISQSLCCLSKSNRCLCTYVLA